MRSRPLLIKTMLGYLMLAFALVFITVCASFVLMNRSMIAVSRAEVEGKVQIVADILTADRDPEVGRIRDIEKLTTARVMYIGQDRMARRVTYRFRVPKASEPPKPQESMPPAPEGMELSKPDGTMPPRPGKGDFNGPETGGGPDDKGDPPPEPHEVANEADDGLLIELESVVDALDTELLNSMLQGEKAAGIRNVDFIGGPVVFASAPVYAGDGEITGAVILYLPMRFVRYMRNSLVVLILFACVLACGLSMVMAFFVSRWLVKPINVLKQTARRLSAGEYGQTVQLNQNDEIGELGDALSLLSVRLKGVITDLRDEKSKLMKILAGIGEGIVAIDREGRVVHHNNAALELLELTSWDAPAGEDSDSNKTRLIGMLHQAAQTGEAVEAVWKNGAERSIGAHVWPLISDDNEPIGAVGLLRDVSEAERLEQMRRDYVSNISHELRTPLTGIRGMVEPLMDGCMETEEEKEECYRIIYQETLRLEKLIGEMLDMGRLEAGRTRIELEPMTVEGILAAAKSRMAVRARECGVDLGANLPAEALPMVMGNEDRILQVLIILLDNALSFTPAGGSVVLSARVQGRSVYLGVRDTGAGIDPTDLPYIWERFYKADKSRLRTTGTGLGLAIAKLLVECMGGRISVQSEPGKGAAFEFSLVICGEEPENN